MRRYNCEPDHQQQQSFAAGSRCNALKQHPRWVHTVKEGGETIGDREMMGIKLTKLLAASVILSQYVFTCAFTTPFSLRTLSYQHDCVKLRVTTSTSEELAVQIRDGVSEQQTLSSATSQDIVVVDGMPTPILVDSEEDATNTYRAGLITIGFITLLFASNSPILRSAWESTSSAPPVLLINAAVSVVGLVGVIASSPFLNQIVNDPSAQGNTSKDANNNGNDLAARIIGSSAIAGVELGLWKFLGTTTNIVVIMYILLILSRFNYDLRMFRHLHFPLQTQQVPGNLQAFFSSCSHLRK